MRHAPQNSRRPRVGEDPVLASSPRRRDPVASIKDAGFPLPTTLLEGKLSRERRYPGSTTLLTFVKRRNVECSSHFWRTLARLSQRSRRRRARVDRRRDPGGGRGRPRCAGPRCDGDRAADAPGAGRRHSRPLQRAARVRRAARTRRREGRRRLCRQLPAGAAVGNGLLNLFDPATGQPVAIIDAAGLTDMRTGAVTALGAKYLARKDSRVLGHIGARGTAYWNVRLLDHLFGFDEIRIHSRRPVSAANSPNASRATSASP